MDLPDAQFAVRVRTIQIIAAALLFGVLMLAAVSIAVVQTSGPMGHRDADALPIVSLVALVMLATNLPLSLILPNVLMRNAVQRVAAGSWSVPPGVDPGVLATDEARLLAARQTVMIVGTALLEAVGLAAGIAYLVEGQAFAMIAVVVPVLVMIAQFPTREGMRTWLERHLALVAELRQLGGPFDVR
jgi:hypothetical protein